MNLLKTFQNMAGSCPSPSGREKTVPDAAPGTETALPGVAVVRERIAQLGAAREAHRELASQREKAAAEVNALVTRLNAAKAQLADRERRIALESGNLPDDMLPEEAEVHRLERQQRILRIRVADWDSKIAEHAAEMDTISRSIKQAWAELGKAADQILYERFCAAAAVMRDASLMVCAFGRCWSRDEPWWRWRFFNQAFTISDPRDGSPILNPIKARYPDQWTGAPAEFHSNMRTLRTEIQAAIGGVVAGGDERLSDDTESN